MSDINAEHSQPQVAVVGASSAEKSRNMAMAAHILPLTGLLVPFSGPVGPFILWYTQRDKDAFVAGHARTACNFHGTLLAVSLIVLVFSLAFARLTSLFALSALFGVSLFSTFLLVPLVGICCLGLAIAGILRAYDGKAFSYPLSYDLVAKIEEKLLK